MAERVIKLLISAEVNSYLDGVDKVAKKSREGATEAELLKQKVEAQRKAFTVAGTAMLAAGGVIAAGLVLATKRAAEFDQAMSNVQAATHETAENMALLRGAALDAGADTVYSAKEAAGAIEELAKAGLSTQSIISGGLTGALDLAAAGGLEVADAAGIASTTLQQFSLSGDKASHVADVLAAGAGKAMGDVSDLSMALSQSGTVAAQFGLSLEETTGSLAAFASKGLLGSDAGTSFRSMLLRLANPTGEAAAKMEELGIQAYDAQGNFVGMTGLAGQLEKGLKGLTQEQRNAALAIIFGQDAIRAANVLYTEGATGIAKWTKEVDDAGYAGETAATRLNNLTGDLEKLSGAFDTALITVGGAGQGPLRLLVQGITEVVDSFNGLPEGAQTAVYWVGAAAAAAALAGGAFLVGVPKVAAYRLAIETLGEGAQRTSRMLGRVTAASGGVAAGAALAVAGGDLLTGWMRSFGQEAEVTANKVKTANNAVELIKGTAADLGGNVSLKEATLQLKALGDALEGKRTTGVDGLISGRSLLTVQKLGAELGNLATTDLPAAQSQFRLLAEGAGLNAKQQQLLLDQMEPYRKVLVDTATEQNRAASGQSLLNDAMGQSESKTKSAADAYLQQADRVSGVTDALRQLYDQMNAANSAQQTAISANADWIEGLAGIAKQVEETGTSLDESTVAGSANASMLAGLAADAWAAAGAQLEVDKATMSGKDAADKYAATLADQRQKFIDTATAAGLGADEVQALADKVFALPSSKEIELLANTDPARDAVDQLIYDISQKRAVLSVDQRPGTIVRPGQPVAYAGGGLVRGPGSGTSDSIPAYLSNGEFIVRAAVVAQRGNREALERMNAGIRRYADGGFVQPQYALPGSYRSAGSVSVSFPDTVTLVDQNGSILTQARVIAGDVVRSHDALSERTLGRG